MDAELLMNIMWTMLGAFLVFFMQAGFAMVETGFTRAKNSGNILMKNMMFKYIERLKRFKYISWY